MLVSDRLPAKKAIKAFEKAVKFVSASSVPLKIGVRFLAVTTDREAHSTNFSHSAVPEPYSARLPGRSPLAPQLGGRKRCWCYQ
jgi:hypothetical protein